MTCLDIISDSTGKEIVAAIQSTDVAQARISEINTAAESKKNEVLASIPEDYRNTVNEVNQIKGDLDTERNARIEADTDHSTRLRNVELKSSTNRYEIENLKAKAEGKLYRTETVEAEAYTVDVPSSVAPYAEVQKIGGKSVVWNQLRQSHVIGTSIGITISSNSNGTINIKGTATSTPIYNQFLITERINFKRDGRKYLVTSNLNIPNGIGISGYDISNTKDFIFSNSEGSDWKGAIYIKVTEGDVLNISNLAINIFDLTQMFGSGNEPTLEECKKIFTADYYPYDAGTLKSFPVRTVRSLNVEGTEIGSMDVSSFTSNFKSAGPAHDEWSNGKVTKRITTVDISNLIFSRDGDKNYWYTSDIPLGLGASRACISNKLSYGERSSLGYTDRTKWYLSGAGFFELYDDTATSPQEVKNNYAGTILQFELDSPTEETAPEIDNYIKVEGGGTLTFESDDTVHMSVPSTDRFIVDLTSTTEETT